MNSGRQTLSDFFKAQFQNPAIKQQCEASGQKAFRRYQETHDFGQLYRLFDDFPCLLPNQDISALKDSLALICQKISAEVTDDGVLLANPHSDGFEIERWQKRLINIAYQYLIDKQGNVRQEVISILGWQPYQPYLKTDIILSAFVGAINHAIIFPPDMMPNNTSLAICHHLNHHYKDWVVNKLIQEHPSFAVTRLVKEHPVSTVVVSTAALGLFGLAASLALVALTKDNKPPQNNDKKPGQ